ncbi:MAG: hypothetical protein FD167_5954, partial [bacterium]
KIMSRTQILAVPFETANLTAISLTLFPWERSSRAFSLSADLATTKFPKFNPNLSRCNFEAQSKFATTNLNPSLEYQLSNEKIYSAPSSTAVSATIASKMVFFLEFVRLNL